MAQKRFASILAVAVLATAAFAAPAAAKSMVINPQAGVTWSDYSFDDDISLSDESGRVGYALGGNVRFGTRLYFSPGLYYQQTGFEATAVDSITAEDFTADVGVNSVYLPLLFGYFLSPSSTATNPASTGLRLYAGPAITFVTSVGDNDFGIEKDDYSSTIVGGVLGAGFDLSVVTFDLSYEIGLSDAFDDDNDDVTTKQNVLRGLIGMKF